MKKQVTTIAEVLNDVTEVTLETERIELHMSDGSQFVVSRDNPRFDLFVKMIRQQRHKGPLFVAGNPKTQETEAILLPISRLVQEFKETPSRQTALINFIAAPSTFTLGFNHERYPDMKKALQRARTSKKELWVAADPFSLEILHIHEAPAQVTRGRGIFDSTCTGEIISFADAQREFQKIKHASGIPFKYLPDCCNARAHEMCRIMVEDGLEPCKVWNYGQGFEQVLPTLQVQTHLTPTGYVKWSFHVAPVVKCRHFANDVVHVVIDPALFERPVSLDQWVEVQQDPHSTVEISGPKPFHRLLKGRKLFFDPLFEQTNKALASHRYDLEIGKIA
jgi:hypothetical protein